MAQEKTYLLIGTVTKDLQPDGTFTNGGTVTYASVIVENLGWRPVIFTAADAKFTTPDYLTHVDWHFVSSLHTTTFKNRYDTQGHRQQTIGPVGASITAADIPPDCLQADIIHLCPLAQDVDISVASACKTGQMVSTPQGWMRQWDKNGIVSLGEWTGADDLLPKLTCSVISIEDIEGDWSIAEKWAGQTNTLIVTLGDEGCTIFHKGTRQTVPPRPAHPIDPTGAGDVFAAAFFIRYQETGNLWQAGRFANVAASMAIERVGPQGAPRRQEIETWLAQNPVKRTSL